MTSNPIPFPSLSTTWAVWVVKVSFMRHQYHSVPSQFYTVLINVHRLLYKDIEPLPNSKKNLNISSDEYQTHGSFVKTKQNDLGTCGVYRAWGTALFTDSHKNRAWNLHHDFPYIPSYKCTYNLTKITPVHHITNVLVVYICTPWCPPWSAVRHGGFQNWL